MPWTVNTYHSKRKQHITNKLGDIVGEDENWDNILDPIGWDDDGKMKFAVMVVSDELEISEEEVQKKLDALLALVPGLRTRLSDIKVADLARLLARVPDVGAKMVALKSILPECDLAKLVSARPSLLLEDVDGVKAQIAEFREALPNLRVDFIIEDFPMWLEHKSPKKSVEELCRSLGVDAEKAQKVLGQNPSRLMMVQSREDMILYDNGSLEQVQASLLKSKDAAPDGW